ncbi:MAG: hypothetical protein HN348_04260, partial [Proteobacteria bacterium]|nr:hypothetical protein [Pseudomonadota bacterium]
MRRLDANPFLVEHRQFGHPLIVASEAWKWRGRWNECFRRHAPLHLEIGPGNGFFITELAQRHPDWNIIGVELRFKRTVLCGKKLRAAKVENARIIRYHAGFLDDLFNDGILAAIYVNHPDPWPKSKHEKNRLIARWFLEDVSRLLIKGGVFRLKSDFKPNVDRVASLLTADGEGRKLPELPLVITGRSEDIIKGDAPWPDDIETNYQSKFRLRGEPV